MEGIVDKLKEKFPGRILKIGGASKKRVYIDIRPVDVPALAKFTFRDMGCRFVTATGIDTPAGIEIIYHFSDDANGTVVSFRVIIKDKKHPEIESIAPIIIGAEWIEREMWEMLGINFKGHPNLKRLLLAEEFPEGKHPLRHDEHES